MRRFTSGGRRRLDRGSSRERRSRSVPSVWQDAGGETENITDGVQLSYSIETLKTLASEPPSSMRVYMGYAGWGPGQLEGELEANAWYIVTANFGFVFDKDLETKWQRAVDMRGLDL